MTNRSSKIGLTPIAKYICVILYIIVSAVYKSDITFAISNAIFIWTLCSALENIDENIVFICFEICFFTFLMAGPIAQEFFGAAEKRSYTEEAILHSNICIIISQITLYIVYCSKIKITIGKRNHDIDEADSIDDCIIESLKTVSRYFFWITFAFMFAYNIHLATYVVHNGYMAFYQTYSKGIWVIVEKIGSLTILCLALFFACQPNKKESKSIIIAYLLYGFTTLFTGKRYEAVFICLFVLIVYSSRRWITRKHLFLIMILMPIIVLGLQAVEYLRIGSTVSGSASNLLVEFLNDVGGSNKVIRFGYMYKDNIPSLRFYSLGNTIDYFLYNFLSKQLFGLSTDPMIYAVEGHSFSNLITMLWNTKLYLNGNGLGSCYIAELYADFGYFGIVVGNAIVAFIIKERFSLSSTKLSWRFLGYFLLFPLLVMPRANFDGPLNYVINLKYIVFLIIIIELSKRIRTRKR